jgi:phosphatidylethanolamine-binding protein (PEBP) family uncharacterized protein
MKRTMRETKGSTRLLATALFVLVALAGVIGCGGPAGTGMASDKAKTSASSEFTLSSPAVRDGQLLPDYRCERKLNGVEDSIPLSWSNVPDGAGSLAVVMHHHPDPADTSKVNAYLLLWGIDPSVTGIPHGGADDGEWFVGANKDGTTVSYTSPCSPSPGPHEYTITVYALSETPSTLPRRSTADVSYDVLTRAIATVTTLDTATLTFVDPGR